MFARMGDDTIWSSMETRQRALKLLERLGVVRGVAASSFYAQLLTEGAWPPRSTKEGAATMGMLKDLVEAIDKKNSCSSDDFRCLGLVSMDLLISLRPKDHSQVPSWGLQAYSFVRKVVAVELYDISWQLAWYLFGSLKVLEPDIAVPKDLLLGSLMTLVVSASQMPFLDEHQNMFCKLRDPLSQLLWLLRAEPPCKRASYVDGATQRLFKMLRDEGGVAAGLEFQEIVKMAFELVLLSSQPAKLPQIACKLSNALPVESHKHVIGALSSLVLASQGAVADQLCMCQHALDIVLQNLLQRHASHCLAYSTLCVGISHTMPSVAWYGAAAGWIAAHGQNSKSHRPVVSAAGAAWAAPLQRSVAQLKLALAHVVPAASSSAQGCHMACALDASLHLIQAVTDVAATSSLPLVGPEGCAAAAQALLLVPQLHRWVEHHDRLAEGRGCKCGCRYPQQWTALQAAHAVVAAARLLAASGTEAAKCLPQLLLGVKLLFSTHPIQICDGEKDCTALAQLMDGLSISGVKASVPRGIEDAKAPNTLDAHHMLWLSSALHNLGVEASQAGRQECAIALLQAAMATSLARHHMAAAGACGVSQRAALDDVLRKARALAICVSNQCAPCGQALDILWQTAQLVLPILGVQIWRAQPLLRAYTRCRAAAKALALSTSKEGRRVRGRGGGVRKTAGIALLPLLTEAVKEAGLSDLGVQAVPVDILAVEEADCLKSCTTEHHDPSSERELAADLSKLAGVVMAERVNNDVLAEARAALLPAVIAATPSADEACIRTLQLLKEYQGTVVSSSHLVQSVHVEQGQRHLVEARDLLAMTHGLLAVSAASAAATASLAAAGVGQGSWALSGERKASKAAQSSSKRECWDNEDTEVLQVAFPAGQEWQKCTAHLDAAAEHWRAVVASHSKSDSVVLPWRWPATSLRLMVLCCVLCGVQGRGAAHTAVADALCWTLVELQQRPVATSALLHLLRLGAALLPQPGWAAHLVVGTAGLAGPGLAAVLNRQAGGTSDSSKAVPHAELMALAASENHSQVGQAVVANLVAAAMGPLGQGSGSRAWRPHARGAVLMSAAALALQRAETLSAMAHAHAAVHSLARHYCASSRLSAFLHAGSLSMGPLLVDKELDAPFDDVDEEARGMHTEGNEGDDTATAAVKVPCGDDAAAAWCGAALLTGALLLAGEVAEATGAVDEAQRLLAECLQLAKVMNVVPVAVAAALVLARLQRRSNNMQQARHIAALAAHLLQGPGGTALEARVHTYLTASLARVQGDLHRVSGDQSASQECYMRGLQLLEAPVEKCDMLSWRCIDLAAQLHLQLAKLARCVSILDGSILDGSSLDGSSRLNAAEAAKSHVQRAMAVMDSAGQAYPVSFFSSRARALCLYAALCGASAADVKGSQVALSLVGLAAAQGCAGSMQTQPARGGGKASARKAGGGKPELQLAARGPGSGSSAGSAHSSHVVGCKCNTVTSGTEGSVGFEDVVGPRSALAAALHAARLALQLPLVAARACLLAAEHCAALQLPHCAAALTHCALGASARQQRLAVVHSWLGERLPPGRACSIDKNDLLCAAIEDSPDEERQLLDVGPLIEGLESVLGTAHAGALDSLSGSGPALEAAASSWLAQQLAALPQGCTVCSIGVLQGGGGLLLTNLAVNRVPLVLTLPLQQGSVVDNSSCKEGSGRVVVGALVTELRTLLADSADSMRGGGDLSTTHAKTQWWKARLVLDRRLGVLLTRLGAGMLGVWRGMLLGAGDVGDDAGLAAAAFVAEHFIAPRGGEWSLAILQRAVEQLVRGCMAAPSDNTDLAAALTALASAAGQRLTSRAAAQLAVALAAAAAASGTGLSEVQQRLRSQSPLAEGTSAAPVMTLTRTPARRRASMSADAQSDEIVFHEASFVPSVAVRKPGLPAMQATPRPPCTPSRSVRPVLLGLGDADGVGGNSEPRTSGLDGAIAPPSVMRHAARRRGAATACVGLAGAVALAGQVAAGQAEVPARPKRAHPSGHKSVQWSSVAHGDGGLEDSTAGGIRRAEDPARASGRTAELGAGSEGSSLGSRSCAVVLVLDDMVQELPWENAQGLGGQPYYRCPCLPLAAVLSSVHKPTGRLLCTQRGSSKQDEGGTVCPRADMRNAYFVLNPEGDLVDTQATFEQWFKEQLQWEGVVGRAPAPQEVCDALQRASLLVYLGHGGAERYVTAAMLRRMRRCAAALLMGCSSGRLRRRGAYGPHGTTWNYLLAGCPSVVGNLWDVTDRDIDRFSQHLLQQWEQRGTSGAYKGTGVDASISVAASRQACRLQQLIGAAPVCYGIPTLVMSPSNVV